MSTIIKEDGPNGNVSWMGKDGKGKRWEDYDTIVCPDGQVVDMTQLLDEQQRAKAALIHIIPYFGGFINKLRIIYTFHVKTQATDGYNLFVNPQFTYNLDLTGKVFVMAHEIMHCVLNHMRRGEGHDPHKSNIAADYEVNSWINDIGLIKASKIKQLNALYDEKYSGWGYEKIYMDNPPGPSNSMQPDKSQQQQAQQQQQQQNQNGQGGGSGDPSELDMPGSPGGNQDNQQNSRTSGNDQSQGVVRPEDCSGQSSGIGDMPDTPGGFFSKKDGDKLAEMEGYDKEGGDDKSVESDWKDSALREVKNMPNGSGWDELKKTIEGMYKVNTDWKKILHQVVGKAINSADTRRAYANKNILVSQDRVARTDKDKFDTMDYMIVFIDTSGSVSDKEVKLILSEVYSMALKKKPLKIYVMYCDTKIHHIDEYTNLKDLKRDANSTTRHGAGGTAFQPLWDILKEDRRFRRCKPDLIMIFTDGDDFSCRRGNDLTIERDKRTMNWLVWCIVDNPSVNLAKNESMTKIIHLSTKDIK